MSSHIFDLALIIGTAAAFGIVGRLLRQPLILTYIITGLVLGVSGHFALADQITLQTFADMGIMFLLFLIGLEINYSSLRLVGKISVILGVLQIIFTSFIGYLIALAFNFPSLESAYIAVALTFSSTIIVVKLLLEKRDIGSLYGKITIGFLLVQDFIAILILIALAGISTTGGVSSQELALTILKGVILFTLVLWIGRQLIPKFIHYISPSQELLFLASLAWCFAVAAAAAKAGFSIEIGGFLAGMALANSSEHYEISGRVRSLRDFFVLIFFVILGFSLVSFNLSGLTFPIILFSLFVLIGHPLIILVILGLWGYKKRTAFLCGVTTAQVSEFSFILVALGVKLGHVSPQGLSLITAVGIVTIAASSYLILHNETVFRYLASYLRLFERHRMHEGKEAHSGLEKSIILIGGHRLGQNILQHLPKEKVLVIDFDPNVTADLKRQGYATLFGDVADLEILDYLDLGKMELVISTSPDFDDNNHLLQNVKKLKKRPPVIVRAEDRRDALHLYREGADYVIIPHFTSGQFLGKALASHPIAQTLRDLKGHDQKLLAAH